MQRLGSILSKIKLSGPGPLQLEQIHAALAEVAGKPSGGAKGSDAKAADADLRVASYQRGRLVIEAKSAARAFELQAFGRAKLLAQLRKQPGLEKLAEVVVKNGAWRAHGQQ